MTFTGIRPGEKIHEIMISEEERYRTVERGAYYVIQPMLPELQKAITGRPAVLPSIRRKTSRSTSPASARCSSRICVESPVGASA